MNDHEIDYALIAFAIIGFILLFTFYGCEMKNNSTEYVQENNLIKHTPHTKAEHD